MGPNWDVEDQNSRSILLGRGKAVPRGRRDAYVRVAEACVQLMQPANWSVELVGESAAAGGLYLFNRADVNARIIVDGGRGGRRGASRGRAGRGRARGRGAGNGGGRRGGRQHPGGAPEEATPFAGRVSTFLLVRHPDNLGTAMDERRGELDLRIAVTDIYRPDPARSEAGSRLIACKPAAGPDEGFLEENVPVLVETINAKLVAVFPTAQDVIHFIPCTSMRSKSR